MSNSFIISMSENDKILKSTRIYEDFFAKGHFYQY